MTRVGIFLIAVAFLTMVALIAGMVSRVTPSQDLEIRTWYDLNAARNNLGGSYLLMNDLDSTTAGYEELASSAANGGKGWQPIGIFPTWAENTSTGFMGTFDGQGYEIRNLFINRPDELAVGLFGEVGREGVIKDIGVVNATVTGNAFAGTLAGLNRGAVHNSYFTGDMAGDYFVGGLVGANEGSVSNSDSNANVTADFAVGGLVGQNSGTVSSTYSTGSVTGNYNVGGLVGYDLGTVSNSYSKASVTGNSSVGGLVGTGAGTVSNSYSTGSVTGNESVGGLVGGGAHTVSNSYSTSSVTGNHTVGGLAGDTFDGTVSNSYSTGSVTGNSSVGGLVGENVRTTMSKSFWDTETSGQSTSAGGMGKTTAEMKKFATFAVAAWSIATVAPGETNSTYIWNIVEDVTYPFLSWHWGCPQGHSSPTRMETKTTPPSYLELTVSPAQVCANVGKQIKIRCSIYPLVNTPIAVSSVDVLLFDSYDTILRQRRMTMNSPWSAYTTYTVLGDEAYYKIKVNFTAGALKGGQKYSEYGVQAFPIVVNCSR